MSTIWATFVLLARTGAILTKFHAETIYYPRPSSPPTPNATSQQILTPPHPLEGGGMASERSWPGRRRKCTSSYTELHKDLGHPKEVRNPPFFKKDAVQTTLFPGLLNACMWLVRAALGSAAAGSPPLAYARCDVGTSARFQAG